MNKTKSRWAVFTIVNVVTLTMMGLYRLYVWFVNLPLAALFGKCYMAQLLHIYCPGCGATRSIGALLRLDIVKAFAFNPIIPVTAVLFLIYDVRAAIAIKQGREKVLDIKAWVWFSYIVFVVAVFVIRNVLLVVFGIDTIGDLAQYWI